MPAVSAREGRTPSGAMACAPLTWTLATKTMEYCQAVVDKALAVLARGNSVAEGRIFDFLNALCGDLVDAESLKQAARAALPAYAQTKAAGIAPGNVLEQAKQHKQQRNNNQVVPAELLRVPTPADA